MRLITLGDSVTFGDHSWPKPLSDHLQCELVNLALPASQNLLQLHRMQEWLYDNDFKPDDIVIWQIGLFKEPVVNIHIDYLEKAKRANRLSMPIYGIIDHFVSHNKVDNSQRVSLLSVSPILTKFNARKQAIDDAEVMQNMLFMFNIIKKLCPRLLIIRGRDDFVHPEHWQNMKEAFVQKGIDFSDDSIHNWCKNKNLPLLSDDEHPTVESMGVYALEVIYPKLKEVGWV